MFANFSLQIKKGWRPGAIPKHIKEIMCHFLGPCPCDTLPVTKRQKADKDTVEEDNEIIQKPTLSVQKKDGDYLITMRPLKNTIDLRTDPNPYLTAKPIKFKITRRAEEKKCDEIRELLHKKGFGKCTCGNIVACCTCRDNREMDALRKCLDECEDKFGVKSLEYKLCLKESASEPKLDIEFTPPGGMVKKNLKKLPNQVYQETQYCEDDFKAVETEANEKSGKGKANDKSAKDKLNDKSGKLGGKNGKGIGIFGKDKGKASGVSAGGVAGSKSVGAAGVGGAAGAGGLGGGKEMGKAGKSSQDKSKAGSAKVKNKSVK